MKKFIFAFLFIFNSLPIAATSIHKRPLNPYFEIEKLYAECLKDGINYFVDGTTLLHESAKKGSVEQIRFLIFKGADIYLTCENKGWTPLIYALRHENWEVFDLLYDLYEDKA